MMTVQEWLEFNEMPVDYEIKLYNPHICEYEAIGKAGSDEIFGYWHCYVKGVKQNNSKSFTLYI